MARRLVRTVVVGGQHVAAGTEETAELKAAVTNPVAWVGESDLPDEAPQGPEEPPRGGPKATADAWRTHAAALGVEVPEDASRDDIVALVDAHNTSNE